MFSVAVVVVSNLSNDVVVVFEAGRYSYNAKNDINT